MNNSELEKQRDSIIKHLEYLGVIPTENVNSRDTHVGQSNYSTKVIQPWAIWLEYGLNPWDADIIKRILRTKEDPGVSSGNSRILDYLKIKHICDERINHINTEEPYYQQFTIPEWVNEICL